MPHNPDVDTVALAIGVIAALAAFLATRIKLGCSECPHCKDIERRKREEQEKARAEYEKLWGFDRDNSDLDK